MSKVKATLSVLLGRLDEARIEVESGRACEEDYFPGVKGRSGFKVDWVHGPWDDEGLASERYSHGDVKWLTEVRAKATQISYMLAMSCPLPDGIRRDKLLEACLGIYEVPNPWSKSVRTLRRAYSLPWPTEKVSKAGKGSTAPGLQGQHSKHLPYGTLGVAVKIENPNWSDRQVAEYLGCTPQALSKSKVYQKVGTVQRAASVTLRKSTKNQRTGDLEFIDDRKK